MPPFESTIQESCSHVKYVLTSKTHGDCGTPIIVPTCKAVSSRVGGNGLAPLEVFRC
jgi:hypothetical protein